MELIANKALLVVAVLLAGALAVPWLALWILWRGDADSASRQRSTNGRRDCFMKNCFLIAVDL